MKVKILFKIRNEPWGGGNQFLKSLSMCFYENGFLADSMENADIALFDSFNDINYVLSAKKNFPYIPFVHRINGPISLYRGKDTHIDKLIHILSKNIADGVIFQSEYSKRENINLGMECPKHNIVIHNAASKIFQPKNRLNLNEKKINIVASSWSQNINKGFNTLTYLDNNLDFTIYSMTFIGSSPVKFKNIKIIPPQNQYDLHNHLLNYDIYFTASKNDSCSNSVLEALAVGIPVVALRSGGTPELVGEAGEYFDSFTGAIVAINKVSCNLEKYHKSIKSRNIYDTYQEYLDFFEIILRSCKKPKSLTIIGMKDIYFYTSRTKFLRIFDKLLNLFRNFLKNLFNKN